MATTVTLDPVAIHNPDGSFTVTGKVSSTVGLGHVAVGQSVEDGPRVNYGSAVVASDGSFAYKDPLTDFKLGNFVATAYLNDKTSVQSAVAPYTFYADGHESTVTSTGEPATSTKFADDGSSMVSVLTGGQTLQSNFFDTYMNGSAPENTFVFDPNHGLDIIHGFRGNGPDHDVVSLKGSDFGNDLAQVLANTHQIKGVGSVIHDPTTGDTVRLVGVFKAELLHNQGDFTFHA